MADDQLSKLRTVIFSSTAKGFVQRTAPTRKLTREECGLYIHIEDAPSYVENLLLIKNKEGTNEGK